MQHVRTYLRIIAPINPYAGAKRARTHHDLRILVDTPRNLPVDAPHVA